MNIQILGTKKCNDTKKAERFSRSVEDGETNYERYFISCRKV